MNLKYSELDQRVKTLIVQLAEETCNKNFLESEKDLLFKQVKFLIQFIPIKEDLKRKRIKNKVKKKIKLG